MVLEEQELETLQSFADEGYILDVLDLIKSGKEATVYRCLAKPEIGAKYLAAKLYKPIRQRGFRNDAIYMEGRTYKPRVMRGLRAKGEFAKDAQYALWAMAEFETQKLLHESGLDVPKPYSSANGAILMEYIGDDESAAKNLNNTVLSGKFEVVTICKSLLRNIRLMLVLDRVHGDLSPFNVLYFNGNIKIIDFPQAVDARSNPNACMLLERDVRNVCNYFAKYGLRLDSQRISSDLWGKYIYAKL